jgi:hypothetical protein
VAASRLLFAGCSSKAGTGPGRPSIQERNALRPAVPGSVVPASSSKPYRAGATLHTGKKRAEVRRPRLRCAGEFLKSRHRAGAALHTRKKPAEVRRPRLRCAGEFLKSRHRAGAASIRDRNAPRSAVPGSVVPASSSRAGTGPGRPSIRERNAPRSAVPGSVVRASSSRAGTGPGGPPYRKETRQRPPPQAWLCRRVPQSRTGPGRPSIHERNAPRSAVPGSVVPASSSRAGTGPGRPSKREKRAEVRRLRLGCADGLVPSKGAIS